MPYDDHDDLEEEEASSSPPAKKVAKVANDDKNSREGPLPAGWTAHVDPATQATYYWNAALSATSWERPEANAAAAAPRPNALWVKHSDPESGVPYFCNTATNETQWEVPNEPFVDATVFAPTVSTTTASRSGGDDEYVAAASFNAVNGRFGHADGKTYWDAMGKSNDRNTRMMSLYFDVSTLEKNRQQAEEKKKKLRKYDWRKYKEIKKKEKTKRRVQELLKD